MIHSVPLIIRSVAGKGRHSTSRSQWSLSPISRIRRVSEPYDGKLSHTVRRALSRQELIITCYRSLTLSNMVFFSILFLKIGDLNLTSYYLYRYVFSFTFYFHWLISSVVNFNLLALCYHMSNGIRHLLWDLGFFLELSKVYTSGIIMLFCVAFLAILNIIWFYFS
jgi:succinate dehydrogenase cytochrome b556 subunit